MNTLDACIYCKEQKPRNRRQARRLKDTRVNRNRERALYRFLSKEQSRV